jgi:hypothetical protein
MATSVENFELMKLLGMGAVELDIPARYSMFEEVSRFFASYPNARQKVLSLLAKGRGKDGLEDVWHYVRLQNEKADAIRSLNPQDFEPEISKELEQGALSLASMKRVEEDMGRREKQIKPEERDDLKNPLVQAAMKFHAIKKTFNVVKELNQTLARYGD